MDRSCRSLGPRTCRDEARPSFRESGMGPDTKGRPNRRRFARPAGAVCMHPPWRGVSLPWPIGHGVAISLEMWPFCLRTYCRDAAKVDKTRLATLTKVRRVGRTWQSSLQKSCSAIQWSSAAVPRFRLTSLTVHENFGLLHSRLAHIALTCGIDMPCAPTSLGYTRGRATQEDPSPMRLARGGLTYT